MTEQEERFIKLAQDCFEFIKNDTQLNALYAELNEAAKDAIAIKLRDRNTSYSFLKEYHAIGNKINARINQIRESYDTATIEDVSV